MARLARIVAAGVAHHVTQRGNRRQTVFFSDEDYVAYRELLREWSARDGLAIWAYCLMPNHAHIIGVPEKEESLHRAIKETHRRYSCRINTREGWRGHLWQGRFASFPLDEKHGLQAIRYVELNPVRANLVGRPQDWPWSSAAAHLSGAMDPLLSPVPEVYVSDWRGYLEETEAEIFLRHERTGRPLGGTEFIRQLEDKCGRTLLPQKRGPKCKADN
ncbi:MAG: transposase [Desulfovibrio sp.]|jgi:putative transposase|nr:transposase [Desulfovibrio sp.]